MLNNINKTSKYLTLPLVHSVLLFLALIQLKFHWMMLMMLFLLSLLQSQLLAGKFRLMKLKEKKFNNKLIKPTGGNFLF